MVNLTTGGRTGRRPARRPVVAAWASEKISSTPTNQRGPVSS